MKLWTIKHHPYSSHGVFVLFDFLENEEYRKNILEKIKEQTQHDTMKQSTNVKAIMSDYLAGVSEPVFQNLFKKSIEMIDIIRRSSSRHPYEEFEVKINDAWSMKHETGHHTIPHSHFPFHYACAYYAEVPQKDVFMNFDEFDQTINIVQDCLVWMPGDIAHCVSPSKEEGTRYSLAFNLEYKKL